MYLHFPISVLWIIMLVTTHHAKRCRNREENVNKKAILVTGRGGP
jgi:hypothetical protein